jgi:hypothetical protein
MRNKKDAAYLIAGDEQKGGFDALPHHETGAQDQTEAAKKVVLTILLEPFGMVSGHDARHRRPTGLIHRFFRRHKYSPLEKHSIL